MRSLNTLRMPVCFQSHFWKECACTLHPKTRWQPWPAYLPNLSLSSYITLSQHLSYLPVSTCITATTIIKQATGNQLSQALPWLYLGYAQPSSSSIDKRLCLINARSFSWWPIPCRVLVSFPICDDVHSCFIAWIQSSSLSSSAVKDLNPGSPFYSNLTFNVTELEWVRSSLLSWANWVTSEVKTYLTIIRLPLTSSLEWWRWFMY